MYDVLFNLKSDLELCRLPFFNEGIFNSSGMIKFYISEYWI